MRRNFTWTICALILLVVLTLGNGLRICHHALRTFTAKDRPFDISPYLSRFEPVRTRLPNDSVIGYVSDKEDWGLRLLAQYALAPALIEAGVNRPVVLGNFHTTHNPRDAFPDKRFFLLQDFGNGVVLMAVTSR